MEEAFAAQPFNEFDIGLQPWAGSPVRVEMFGSTPTVTLPESAVGCASSSSHCRPSFPEPGGQMRSVLRSTNASRKLISAIP